VTAVARGRRAVLGAIGASLAAVAMPGWAQRSGPARVAFISSGVLGQNFSAFREGLAEFGRVPGGPEVRLEQRAAPVGEQAYATMAEELVGERVDVVAVSGVGTRPMLRAIAGRLPVVFGYSGDPVEAGLVKSLGRPGVNATGVSMLALELVGKRISLLREVVSGLKRVAVLANPNHSGQQAEYRESAAAAVQLGLEMRFFPLRGAGDFEAAFQEIARARFGAMDFFPDSVTISQAKVIAAFSQRERIPAISGWGAFARDGNVLSYGPNLGQAFRQLAGHVDRIIRGAPAESLPVEFPTRVEMIVNLRAARAIGLAVPQSVLLRADQVIN
jgi:putative tryptophan/tyrosine transport system substrate-binding protein